MHISRIFKEREKVNIDMEKANIGLKKTNLGEEKANIESVFTAKTASHIDTLQKALKAQLFFGRSDVQHLLNLKPTRCSELLREMAEHGIIEPVESLNQCQDMEKVSIDFDIKKIETR